LQLKFPRQIVHTLRGIAFVKPILLKHNDVKDFSSAHYLIILNKLMASADVRL